MINKKSLDALYLLFMVALLVVGISFVAVGIKNYSDSDKVAELIEPSNIYKDQGYKSIDEWKIFYEEKNLKNIFIGVGVFGLAAVLAFYKKHKRK